MTINKNQKYQSNSDIISLLRQCALLDGFMQSEDQFLSLLEETREDFGTPAEKSPLSPVQESPGGSGQLSGKEPLPSALESPMDSGQLSEEELLWAAGGISRPRHSPGEDHS